VLRLPAEVLCKRLQTASGAGGEEGGLGLGGWHRALADIDTECWKAQSRAISAHLGASRFISRFISDHLGSSRLTSTHHGSLRLLSAGKASWAAILVRDVPFGGLLAADEGGPAVFFLFYRIYFCF